MSPSPKKRKHQEICDTSVDLIGPPPKKIKQPEISPQFSEKKRLMLKKAEILACDKEYFECKICVSKYVFTFTQCGKALCKDCHEKSKKKMSLLSKKQP